MLPLPPGTPITLLPYGTPAFYLASYTGPTAGLTKQFHSALQGLGAGDWNDVPNSAFIIGWIKVENKQGEDKGITIIYPTKLCLSFVPHSSPRTPLDYIPELPTPLQPSPQVPPALPSFSAFAEVGRPASAPVTCTQRPSIITTPTSESLYSFRALTLSKSKDLRSVAAEVGEYVDAVARERERERERMKKERESGTAASPKHTRTNTSATTPAAAPTPMSVEPTAVTPSAIVQPPTLVSAGPSNPPQLPPPPVPSMLQPPVSIQNFYPSPPQSAPSGVPQSGVKTSPVTAPTPLPMAVDSTPVAPFPSTPTPIASEPQPVNSPSSPSGVDASTAAYDPYAMDSTWSNQPTDDTAFLGMDMDMDFGMVDDMGFGLSIGSSKSNAMSFGSDARGGTVNGGAPSSLGFGLGGGDMGMGMEFEAFTDDDFSFFDRPTKTTIPPPVLPTAPTPHFPSSGSGSGSTTHSRNASGSHTVSLLAGAMMSPPGFGDIHGAGPPHSTTTLYHGHTTQNAQMWTPGALTDGYTPTPRSTVDHRDSMPPELLLPSPGAAEVSPESHSAPATPTKEVAGVYLNLEAAIATNAYTTAGAMKMTRPSLVTRSSSALFEPIPFSSYHREADGKYAMGKFAMHMHLPSPPAEEGYSDCLSSSLDASTPASDVTAARAARAIVSLPASPSGFGLRSSGWGFKYNAATDPRIGVVTKLIGVKRKSPPLSENWAGNLKKKGAWNNRDEDEDGAMVEMMGVELEEGEGVESEEEEAMYDNVEIVDSPNLSRPTTPPPSYLPLGPSLLATHFQHSHLLPLSIPLRPPGASITPLNLTSTPAHPLIPSVPTPVSPAATMGAASEMSRSLEAAASAVAVEVAENPLWAETWKANAVGPKAASGTVWAGDVRAAAELMEGAAGIRGRDGRVEGTVGLGALLGLEESTDDSGPRLSNSDDPKKSSGPQLRPLEAPMISVGKGDAVIQVLPPALRFWEKLGLGPKGGRKDVSVFVLYEDDRDRQLLVESWLAGIANAYQVLKL